MPQTEKIVVLGSAGQIGTDLVDTLRQQHGSDNVIATDIKDQPKEFKDKGPFVMMDVLDANAVYELIKKNNIKQVYLLAALLSATAEQKMKAAWKLNMEGLFLMLDYMKENPGLKMFWPSSIAAFGPTTPKRNTPQDTIMDPATVYGISKQVGERWCEYYHQKFNVDVRSIRYPGLISWKAEPGGGTTDYAVNIFHEALQHKKYECFLNEQTMLPMMYMPDAIRGTIELMNTNAQNVKVRSSYNFAAFSFTPVDLVNEIQKHIPEFTCTYKEDFRQQIANGWPQSIDDSVARAQWGWKHEYDLPKMTGDMLSNLSGRYEG
ncbi:MAG TPA: NAD-dependent epimerase/dehydratase family protein [Bacteroidia bacterium]|nr:NAD-dependent epimerase/dehydratase family protein [Bacteroidia bacterium]HNU32071.1 NAD-dependent epimerase/dehydratase family protein [Bacteroidia bacterium]